MDEDFFDSAPWEDDCYDCYDRDPDEPILMEELDEPEDYPEDDMDGDHESALASAGWGTDEDYGCFGGDDW